MTDLGIVKPGATIYIPFTSFAGSTGASITLTGLAVTDIEVYKDGSTTQRASDSGYTLLDTDGIDFDALTGIHGFSINLADNTTAGFWAAGSRYFVVVSAVTVDTQTVSFVAATFVIGLPGAALNTTIATLSSQTSFTLTDGPAEDDALNGCRAYIHDVASAVQGGFAVVADYAGSTKTVTLVAGTTFTVATTDNIMVFPPALVPTVLGRTVDISAGGEVGIDWANIGSPTTAQNLSGTNIDVDQVVASVSGAVGSVAGLTPATVHSDLDDIQARLPAALTAGGNIKADMLALNGGAQSAADLKDFADDGYDPSTNKVQGVVLTDTVTTYTGDTPQTGDSFARLGAPAGASVSADVAAVKSETAAIVADTNELQTDWVNGGRLDLIIDAILEDTGTTLDDLVDNLEARLGTPSDLGSGATIAANLVDVEAQTDDLAAFITRLTGTVVAQGTIGATGNSTTTLHLAGLTYGDDEINNYLIVVRDVSNDEYHARYIEDWSDTGDLVTVATLPFTPENSVDTYWILPFRRDVTGGGLDAAGVRAAVGLASANLDTQLGTIDSNVDAILIDTGTTLQGELDGIQADTEDIQSRLPPALVSGRMASDAVAISGSTLAADNVEANIGNLDAMVSTRATPTQVNAEVLDVLVTDTFAEPLSVPSATSSLKDKLSWLFTLGRNKRTQTSTTELLRNDGDSATIGTSSKSDDGTTFTRGKYT